MSAWEEALLQAASNESAGNSAHLRRELMAGTLGKLLLQRGDESYAEKICPQPGRKTKSNERRTLRHAEKEVKVKRTHRLCPDCRPGIPLPDRRLHLLPLVDLRLGRDLHKQSAANPPAAAQRKSDTPLVFSASLRALRGSKSRSPCPPWIKEPFPAPPAVH